MSCLSGEFCGIKSIRDEKTVLITGTSSGIGKSVARIFKAEGWNVIATMRKPEAETELTQLPNVDDYSNDLLVSGFDLLLNYIKRYYEKQFKTRKSVNSDLLTNFERLSKNYIISDELQRSGWPAVTYSTDKLHVSTSYFGDLLKKETGLSAQDHLHLELIKKAKILLLGSDASISQIVH